MYGDGVSDNGGCPSHVVLRWDGQVVIEFAIRQVGNYKEKAECKWITIMPVQMSASKQIYSRSFWKSLCDNILPDLFQTPYVLI
jgi:hypothetical protein